MAANLLPIINIITCALGIAALFVDTQLILEIFTIAPVIIFLAFFLFVSVSIANSALERKSKFLRAILFLPFLLVFPFGLLFKAATKTKLVLYYLILIDCEFQVLQYGTYYGEYFSISMLLTIICVCFIVFHISSLWNKIKDHKTLDDIHLLDFHNVFNKPGDVYNSIDFFQLGKLSKLSLLGVKSEPLFYSLINFCNNISEEDKSKLRIYGSTYPQDAECTSVVSLEFIDSIPLRDHACKSHYELKDILALPRVENVDSYRFVAEPVSCLKHLHFGWHPDTARKILRDLGREHEHAKYVEFCKHMDEKLHFPEGKFSFLI